MIAGPPGARAGTWLWMAQRGSAMVLAVAVLVHLLTIIVAVEGGISAAEITARAGGSGGWAAFYGVFVLAAAVHAPIGLRTILNEMTPLRGLGAEVVAVLMALLIAGLGLVTVIDLYRFGGGA